MPLKVQEFLRNNGTLGQLENDLSIKVTLHPSDNICILNYSQLDSPKTNEIVRETRGLVLELGSWDIVAKAFNRFFNLNEVAKPPFNWDKFFVQEKCDGSLILLYNWEGKWRVNTRNSFADRLCGHSNKTWAQLFFEGLRPEIIDQYCSPRFTYVFEFCSPYNKVVRHYSTPTFFLLSIFDNQTGQEVPDQNLIDEIASDLGCERPQRFNFTSIEKITKFINEIGETDPTFEGVVLCDNQLNRLKVKNPLYLSIHRLKDNGNIFNPKHVLPYLLKGDIDELIIYIPEVEGFARDMKEALDTAYSHMLELWAEAKTIESQKEFAQFIVPKTKFSSVLFTARKLGKEPKEIWKDFEDLILKVLFFNEHI